MGKLNHHYSGKKSEKFWMEVNSLIRKTDQASLYSLGCALQYLESYVLGQLENAKQGTVRQKTYLRK